MPEAESTLVALYEFRLFLASASQIGTKEHCKGQ